MDCLNRRVEFLVSGRKYSREWSAAVHRTGCGDLAQTRTLSEQVTKDRFLAAICLKVSHFRKMMAQRAMKGEQKQENDPGKCADMGEKSEKRSPEGRSGGSFKQHNI